MPKYVYYCETCDSEFKIRHSLGETIEICQLCEATNTVSRRPSEIFLSKKINNLEGKSKPGSIVRETIEESRHELKTEQEKLTKREYKK